MISIIVTLAVLGLLTWAITTIVPMPDKFKQVIQVVAIVGGVILALRALDLWPK